MIGQGYNLTDDSSLAKELIDLFNSNKYNKFTCLVAFASYGGITALTPYIQQARERGTQIKIILGVDEKCTSKEALEEVLSWDVNAFIYHTLNTNIFHPKIYLFENADYYTLIVGSNNLTEGGLVHNVECSLLVQDMQGTSINKAFYDYWKEMLDSSDKNLFEITQELIDQLYEENVVPSGFERVTASVEKLSSSEGSSNSIFTRTAIQQNPEGFVPKRLRRKVRVTKKNNQEETSTEVPVRDGLLEIGEEVLIAEIGGGNRWKQINFPVEIFENFFGARRGDNNYWIDIMNIAHDGSLGNVEKRQAVSVMSNNYRFEINCSETTGQYPGKDVRPIVIFIKVSDGNFLYHVLLQEHDAYEQVKEYLYRESHNKGNQLKRAIIHVEALRALYPQLII